MSLSNLIFGVVDTLFFCDTLFVIFVFLDLYSSTTLKWRAGVQLSVLLFCNPSQILELLCVLLKVMANQHSRFETQKLTDMFEEQKLAANSSEVLAQTARVVDAVDKACRSVAMLLAKMLLYAPTTIASFLEKHLVDNFINTKKDDVIRDCILSEYKRIFPQQAQNGVYNCFGSLQRAQHFRNSSQSAKTAPKNSGDSSNNSGNSSSNNSSNSSNNSGNSNASEKSSKQFVKRPSGRAEKSKTKHHEKNASKIDAGAVVDEKQGEADDEGEDEEEDDHFWSEDENSEDEGDAKEDDAEEDAKDEDEDKKENVSNEKSSRKRKNDELEPFIKVPNYKFENFKTGYYRCLGFRNKLCSDYMNGCIARAYKIVDSRHGLEPSLVIDIPTGLVMGNHLRPSVRGLCGVCPTCFAEPACLDKPTTNSQLTNKKRHSKTTPKTTGTKIRSAKVARKSNASEVDTSDMSN